MIEVRGLTKRYGETTAVSGLSFDVMPGKVTGFLGPNGAGKTTTMRLILGLDYPNAGTATIDGKQYASLAYPMRERADEARAAVIARPVIYAAVWRSSRNCHHARAPSAAALVTCAGLAAVAASALAVQSAWSASRSACTSQNATPAPSIP
jgi:ABC-type branched-subunit amino acid transport system ATPase component